MREGELNDDQVAEVARDYDLLVGDQLSKCWSLFPLTVLLPKMLKSGQYFYLPMPKTAKVLNLQSTFDNLRQFVNTSFTEREKGALNAQIKEILEAHLAQAPRNELDAITAKAKRDVVSRQLPVSVDEGHYFVKSLEILLYHGEVDLVPCEVHLFGPCARGHSSPESHVNIAIISDGFGEINFRERKGILERLTERSESRLLPIGITPNEAKQKYSLGISKLLFLCKQKPGLAHNWELSKD